MFIPQMLIQPMVRGRSIRQADAESFSHVADLSVVNYITTRSLALDSVTLSFELLTLGHLSRLEGTF